FYLCDEWINETKNWLGNIKNSFLAHNYSFFSFHITTIYLGGITGEKISFIHCKTFGKLFSSGLP
ncbi:hypothetical protein SNEBB_007744, partial [Seison nebaliae]